ncbi:unnamed protein product [Mytilus coruscus]|uniref:Uncharacterized protein n=1 Tax=Mytilus coruscus TaxID=42192 RepID=A0A6J8ED21_MYTCO|nr:unnamed protein product [Mytilus coruscus]
MQRCPGTIPLYEGRKSKKREFLCGPCEVSLFNRKRGGEVQRLTVAGYLNGKTSNALDTDILSTLSDFEVQLFPSTNPYRGLDVLREIRGMVCLKQPEAFTFTALRNHIETLTQLYDINESIQDQLAHDKEEKKSVEDIGGDDLMKPEFWPEDVPFRSPSTNKGQTHAYLRDCHNTGRSYSIQDPRFDDLEPSLNHTTCIYEKGSNKIMVCVTICDTDFCNGPQIDGGSTLQIQTWLNVLCAVVVIFRQFS